MVKRANLVPGYLNRVVYRQYQNAQRERWKTENNGEDFTGGRWEPVDPVYAAYKKKKWADSPGGGGKLLIRTKRLFDSVVGPHSDHLKLVGDRSIRIATSVPYAEYVDEKRTFTSYSVVFKKKIMKGLSDYLLKNIVRGG